MHGQVQPARASRWTRLGRHRKRSLVHGLEHHLAAVQPLLERYGYGAVFLAIFVEGIGIPAPGQTLLIAAALLAGARRPVAAACC